MKSEPGPQHKIHLRFIPGRGVILKLPSLGQEVRITGWGWQIKQFQSYKTWLKYRIVGFNRINIVLEDQDGKRYNARPEQIAFPHPAK